MSAWQSGESIRCGRSQAHVAGLADPPKLSRALRAEFADDLALAAVKKGALLLASQEIALTDRAKRWFARC